jgi:hypothetical protein
MQPLPLAVPLTIAALAAFLIFITALKYAVADAFARTRLGMTAFFVFIVVTLSVSFWHYALESLPFAAPAALVGLLVGQFVGARAAQERLLLQGAEEYMEHFAHVHLADVKNLQWWSIINFYTVMGALLVINFVGLSDVIFGGEHWADATSAVGAFLLGTLLPYLIHLWAIKTAQKSTSTASEA